MQQIYILFFFNHTGGDQTGTRGGEISKTRGHYLDIKDRDESVESGAGDKHRRGDSVVPAILSPVKKVKK